MQRYIFIVAFIVLIVGCATHPSPRNMTNIKQKAESGDVNAQAELGFSYQYGDGVEKNPIEALKWNLMAANQGSPMAQHNLAVMYDEGVDIPENNTEAIKWYRKAAEQGHPRAQLNLGIMYWQGEGVNRNLQQAWNLLNSVRISSTDKKAKWAARGALDEIKKEIGSKVGPLSYPEWDGLKESAK
jgi:TPR repeat protein